MHAEPERTTLFSPQIVLLAIAFHVLLLVALAMVFRIVKLPEVADAEPPHYQTVTFPPPPPVVDPEPVRRERPLFQQRQPVTPPFTTPVQPSHLTPVAAPSPGPATIMVGEPIPEQPVAQPLPPYPRYALEHEIEGRVVLSITILPDGSVVDVRVLRATPPGVFDRAALNSVQRWRYRPSGATRVNVVVHMDFELRAG